MMVKRRCAIAALAVGLVAVGCNSDDPTSTPVTHDDVASGEAILVGRLGGSPTCLWLEFDGDRRALVLPAGSQTREEGDVVVLQDGDGSESARTGDLVSVTGGYRPDSDSCIDGETGAIYAGTVVKKD